LLHERLAELQDDPVGELQQAAALEPWNAKYWERLGSQAEIAGNLPLAEQALLAAADKSRLYQPRYLLAQYYFRRSNRAQFDRWSQAALDVAPGDVTPLLDLAWYLSGTAIGERTIGCRPLVARQIITLLCNRGQPAAARAAAEHLAEVAGVDDLRALLGYVNQMLAGQNVRAARMVWQTLCRRRLAPYSGDEAVTNGDFGHAPLSGGFDWHFEPPPGVVLGRSPGALRITFTGNQPESCVLAWQYVPLQQGRTIHVGGDRPEPGLGWTFFVPKGGEWREWNGHGPAPGEIARLTLMYRRPLGVPRLEGMVTVPAVRLEMGP
jgi:hypothetical protein